MTIDDRIVLCGDSLCASPYVFSVYVALREKGLGFRYEPIALENKEHHRPEYVDASMFGRVPALEREGFWLSESSAIVEYLDDVYPAPGRPSLLPLDPEHRARARQVMSWLRSGDLGALRNARSSETLFLTTKVAPLKAGAAEAAAKLIRVASRLVTDRTETAFGTWSVADADLAFMLHRLIANGDDVPENVRAYAARQWERPSIRDFLELPRVAPPS